MFYLVGFAAVLVGIVLLQLWQRTNAAVVFFSLCAGSVLAQQVSDDATIIGSSFVHSSFLTSNAMHIALISLPAVLSGLAMRKSISNGQLVLNLFPAISVAALAAILIVPLLGYGQQFNLQATIIWQQLDKASELVIVGGVIVSIVSLWISTHRKHHRRHH